MTESNTLIDWLFLEQQELWLVQVSASKKEAVLQHSAVASQEVEFRKPVVPLQHPFGRFPWRMKWVYLHAVLNTSAFVGNSTSAAGTFELLRQDALLGNLPDNCEQNIRVETVDKFDDNYRFSLTVFQEAPLLDASLLHHTFEVREVVHNRVLQKTAVVRVQMEGYYKRSSHLVFVVDDLVVAKAYYLQLIAYYYYLESKPVVGLYLVLDFANLDPADCQLVR